MAFFMSSQLVLVQLTRSSQNPFRQLPWSSGTEVDESISSADGKTSIQDKELKLQKIDQMRERAQRLHEKQLQDKQDQQGVEQGRSNRINKIIS